MIPEIGEVYDIPGQLKLIEIIAIDKISETHYTMAVYQISKVDHSDTTVYGTFKIPKADFAKAKKVDL